MKRVWNRFNVLFVGILVAALLCAMVAAGQSFSGSGFGGRALTWFIMMGGPTYGTYLGMGHYHYFIHAGWLGLFLASAYPIKPHPVTGMLSGVGIASWFWAGFMSLMVMLA